MNDFEQANIKASGHDAAYNTELRYTEAECAQRVEWAISQLHRQRDDDVYLLASLFGGIIAALASWQFYYTPDSGQSSFWFGILAVFCSFGVAASFRNNYIY